MNMSRVWTNRDVILEKFLYSDKSRAEVAREIGIGVNNFARFLTRDCAITFDTARKIVRHFGGAAISIDGKSLWNLQLNNRLKASNETKESKEKT